MSPSASAQIEPQLSFGGVSPPEGDITNLFTFSVTFTDFTNTPPNSVTVHIDGIAYIMGPEDDLDTNYSDGKIYSYSTRLNVGTHTYMFSATSGNLTIHYPPNGLPISGPTVTDAGLQNYAQCCAGFTYALIATVIIIVVVFILIGIYLFKKKNLKENLQTNYTSSYQYQNQYPSPYNQPYSQHYNPNPNQTIPQPQTPSLNTIQTQATTQIAGQPTTHTTIQANTQTIQATIPQSQTTSPHISTQSSQPNTTTQPNITQPNISHTQTPSQDKPKIDAKPVSSSAKREICKKKTECFMCRGDIWPNDMVVSCRCGKDFH
ncbi:MAG: hypothetical protein QXT63_05975, partial [Thermoplasmata archaeon]